MICVIIDNFRGLPANTNLVKYILLCFSLGKDIHLIVVYHHVFLSISLFNLYCDITHLRRDNSLLM